MSQKIEMCLFLTNIFSFGQRVYLSLKIIFVWKIYRSNLDFQKENVGHISAKVLRRICALKQ